jgi:hypothetical protein
MTMAEMISVTSRVTWYSSFVIKTSSDLSSLLYMLPIIGQWRQFGTVVNMRLWSPLLLIYLQVFLLVTMVASWLGPELLQSQWLLRVQLLSRFRGHWNNCVGVDKYILYLKGLRTLICSFVPSCPKTMSRVVRSEGPRCLYFCSLIIFLRNMEFIGNAFVLPLASLHVWWNLLHYSSVWCSNQIFQNRFSFKFVHVQIST